MSMELLSECVKVCVLLYVCGKTIQSIGTMVFMITKTTETIDTRDSRYYREYNVYTPYITHLICLYCTLFHLLHLAFAVRPSIYLYVHNLIHSFTLVLKDSCCEIVRYYCMVGTRGTRISYVCDQYI